VTAMLMRIDPIRELDRFAQQAADREVIDA
jgi:hypothetical protein